MNFVGKILTVLICVLCVVFATMAVMVYATHTNWRQVVMGDPGGFPKGLNQQLEELKVEKANVEAQLLAASTSLKEEQVMRRDRLTQLETTIDELRLLRSQYETQIQNLKTSEGQAVVTMKSTQETLAKLRDEVETLRRDIREAQQDRDENFAESVRLADLLQQADVKAKRLEGEKIALGVDVTRQRDLLRVHDVNPDQDPAGMLPRVNGLVMAVAGSGVVEVSIGEDDGLKKGHQLQVYRTGGGENRYLGRLEVMETAADRAVCRVMPKFRTGAIQVGDRVTSKFD
ncbi:MAG TPA: hypothetical protein DD670_04945 [Planctomycetaceae bacterium]|nr:hypothetical protein [Planctomycetaceae bacterium]